METVSFFSVPFCGVNIFRRFNLQKEMCLQVSRLTAALLIALVHITLCVASSYPTPAYCPATTPKINSFRSLNLNFSSSGVLVHSLQKYTTLGSSCGYLVAPVKHTGDTHVFLDFAFVSLTSTDYVMVFDGNSTSSPLIASFTSAPFDGIQHNRKRILCAVFGIAL